MSQTDKSMSPWKQALLVAVGIAIAILLSIRTYVSPVETVPVAIPASAPTDSATNTQEEKVVSEKEETGGGGPKINSTARLFQYFTENLPYLNSK